VQCSEVKWSGVVPWRNVVECWSDGACSGACSGTVQYSGIVPCMPWCGAYSGTVQWRVAHAVVRCSMQRSAVE
jgi:hypothetical protein